MRGALVSNVNIELYNALHYHMANKRLLTKDLKNGLSITSMYNDLTLHINHYSNGVGVIANSLKKIGVNHNQLITLLSKSASWSAIFLCSPGGHGQLCPDNSWEPGGHQWSGARHWSCYFCCGQHHQGCAWYWGRTVFSECKWLWMNYFKHHLGWQMEHFAFQSTCIILLLHTGTLWIPQ